MVDDRFRRRRGGRRRGAHATRARGFGWRTRQTTSHPPILVKTVMTTGQVSDNAPSSPGLPSVVERVSLLPSPVSYSGFKIERAKTIRGTQRHEGVGLVRNVNPASRESAC